MANNKQNTRGVLLASLAKVMVTMLVFGVALFLSAGRLNWGMGWAVVGVFTLNTAILSLLMERDLLAERSRVQAGTKRWDLFMSAIVGRVGPLATLVVAGLDARWGWTSGVWLSTQWVALALMTLGTLFTDWAVLSNRYFAATVRIQTERGQTVVTSGPYELMRHPGYVGAMVANLFSALALGSLWALLPAALTTVVTVWRTTLEDRTLRAELPGYLAYTKQTRHRLLPGVW